MDVDGVMAAYLPVVRVCTALSRQALYTVQYTAITPTTSMSTDTIEPFL